MEKEIRDFKITYTLDWTYGVDISKLKQDLVELEKLGATHVEIDPYTEYDCAYVTICAISRREETDEEALERIRIQQQRIEQEKQYELQQL